MQKYNCRQDVPEKYKWNLTDFFKNESDFENSFKECVKLVDELKAYEGCTKNANLLQEFIEKEIKAVSMWMDLYVYAYLINDQELGVSLSIERKNKCETLNMNLNVNTSFFAPELLKLSSKEFEALFDNNKKLELYREDLTRTYREKGHILEPREENIVESLVNSMNHFDEMSSTLLNREHNYGFVINDEGEKEILTTTNYRRIMKKADRSKRKKIYNQFNKVLDNYGITHANLLNSYVKMNNSLAEIHHFENAWERKLFGLNMPNEAYQALVSSIEENTSVLQKYFDLKRQVLGFENIHQYDLPLDIVESKHEYSIDEAQELVRRAITPLGKEYVEAYNKIVDNHYVDYCQYKGKCSGGYSFSTLTHDSRILMSFNGDLSSVSTLAHEAGHNVHHQFCMKNNPLIYREVSSLVSEVASLTNECLLSSYLAEHADTKEEKLAGLANIMDVITSNLFGAVREGKMEEDMYQYSLQGGSLTKEYLNDLTRDSLKKYYGKSVCLDKYAHTSWMTRSHYYMNFYLYSYAFCISIAMFVASNILSGNNKILEKYHAFLSAGSNVWPIDAFKILGVDLCDKTIYEEAIKYFDSLIDEFKSIYNG